MRDLSGSAGGLSVEFDERDRYWPDLLLLDRPFVVVLFFDAEDFLAGLFLAAVDFFAGVFLVEDFLALLVFLATDLPLDRLAAPDFLAALDALLADDFLAGAFLPLDFLAGGAMARPVYAVLRCGVGVECKDSTMTEEVWRPLGFEGDDAATYDALHDGVPNWMAESFWVWMREQFVRPPVRNAGRVIQASRFRPSLLLDVERVCRVRVGFTGTSTDGMTPLRVTLQKVGAELRVADYLLSRGDSTHPDTLDNVLHESGSLWKVGERAGKPGLVRRVPEGVQTSADAVMASAGAAGVKLAQAWERAFGVSPDPTGAYALAVRAVEDAAIPVVVPKQAGATLGHVIGQLRADGDWSLPLTREDADATTASIVLAQCRALWKGHHDRHGGVADGQPVGQEEAEAAVTLAVSLVQWFASGMIARG